MSRFASQLGSAACAARCAFRNGDSYRCGSTIADVSPRMGWCRPQYSLDEARAWIAAQEELARQGAAYEFSIWSEGRYVGGCGINHINKANRFPNLGCWVRTSAMGRGIAPAAVRLVADHAIEKTDLIRLEIVCALGNVRSQRVAEKVGATREGVATNPSLSAQRALGCGDVQPGQIAMRAVE